MNKIINQNILFLSLTFLSCSTMKDSISVGVLSGATSGTLTSQYLLKNKSGKSTAIGAATGAIFGGITSYFIHRSLEKRDARVRKKVLFNLENFGISNQKENQRDIYPRKNWNE